jgi:hypothetical protein
MTILAQSALAAKPDVADALQDVIAAAVRFMTAVSGSFADASKRCSRLCRKAGEWPWSRSFSAWRMGCQPRWP